MPDGLDFRKVEISGYDIVEYLQFIGIQVILCDARVFQSGHLTVKGCQSHERFVRIGSFKDNLSRSVPMSSIMQLVLDDLKNLADSSALGL